MYATDFIFDGIQAGHQGFMICSFQSDAIDTSDSGCKIEFTTINPSGTNTWLKTNANYSEPLTFSFSICKNVCGNENDMYFNQEDIAFIMRWLVRKEYCYIHFLQKSFEDVYYNCRLQAEQYFVNGKTAGFNITGTCDAPFGYSREQTITLYPVDHIQTIYDDSDEIGQTHPYIELTCKTNGMIEVQNISSGQSAMQIKNCTQNETITIGQDYQIKSTVQHNNLSKDFNYVYFSFGNTFSNRITEVKVVNCTVKLTWRSVRKGVC